MAVWLGGFERLANEDGAAMGDEHFLSDVADLRRSDGEEVVKDGVDALRVAVEESEAGQVMHQAEAGHVGAHAAFEHGVEVGTEFHFELPKLGFGDAFVADAGYDLVESGDGLLGGVFGLVQHAGDHEGWAVVVEEVAGGVMDAAADFESDLRFEDEAAIEAGGAAGVEGAIEHAGGEPAGSGACGRGVTDGDGWNLGEFFGDAAAA